MKELSIAGKATRYDEALKEAVIAHKDEDRHLKATLERIFPELKESEDERIRKAIIEIVKKDEERIGTNAHLKKIQWLEKQGEHAKFINGIQVGDKVTRNEDGVLVNLSQLNRVAKKQGEQKPADKVEPKFKVGDWIIHQGTENIYQVVAVIDNQYQLKYGDNYTIQNCADVDRCARLWDITKDAKDGDVLAAHECLVLFKEIDGLNIRCYCTYHYLNHQAFYVDTLQNKTPFHPATKEQRDTLIKVMADAGYTFDFEKKKLKRIEQKPVEWSEEDKKMLNEIVKDLQVCKSKDISRATKDAYQNEIDWLKSLKDRVQPQPKQEWGEEDEEKFRDVIRLVEQGASVQSIRDHYTSWLKSLKERYTWKPSEEQMKALYDSIPEMVMEISEREMLLNSLYKDLKKLRDGKL